MDILITLFMVTVIIGCMQMSQLIKMFTQNTRNSIKPKKKLVSSILPQNLDLHASYTAAPPMYTHPSLWVLWIVIAFCIS